MRSRYVLVVVIVAFAASVSAAFAARQKIVVEAENYSKIKASMVKKKDSKASGKNRLCIWIPLRRPHATTETGPADDGYAEYKIKIPQTAQWYFWARCKLYDSCGNSFFILFDSTKVTKKTQYITSSTYGKWRWVGPLKTKLTKGVHTIRVQNREDGARMDQFLLTTDPKKKWQPTRIEKETAQYIIKLR